MIPYISTADLTDALGKDVTSDDYAAIAIDSSCQAVRMFLGQDLNYLADDVVELSGTNRLALLLPQWPVVAVTDVTVDDVALGAEDFYADAAGLLWRSDGSVWAAGIRNIAVTYSHGYAVSESDVEDDPLDATPKPDRMPSDIRKVALELASRIFLASGVGTDDVQESADGPGPTTLTEADRFELGHYRVPAVG